MSVSSQAHYDVKLPFTRPDTSLHLNEWNEIEFLFDANIVRATLNYGSQVGGVTEEGYGWIALYVGGTGEVQFKDLAYKNLGTKVRDPINFFAFPQAADQRFLLFDTTAVADFNHDGHQDIVSGPYIYYGPDYEEKRDRAR